MHARPAALVPARALLALALALAASLATPAIAADVRRDFYEAKRTSTTLEAWRRAESNLRQVSLGMKEIDFLSAMQMEVLSKNGEPYDVRIDGYLAKASAKVNRKAEGRALVFGYRDGKREVERVTVVLVDHQVSAIHGDVVTAVVAPPPAAEPEALTAEVLAVATPEFDVAAAVCEEAAQ